LLFLLHGSGRSVCHVFFFSHNKFSGSG
jgi:hypothetical protein